MIRFALVSLALMLEVSAWVSLRVFFWEQEAATPVHCVDGRSHCIGAAAC
jgi:hypothetical protein